MASKEEELQRNMERISKLEQDKKLMRAGGVPVALPSTDTATILHNQTEIHKRITEQHVEIQQLTDWMTSVDEKLTLILAILAPSIELVQDEKELIQLIKASILQDRDEAETASRRG